ncbi:hypothetical protein [Melghirimyces algeriensis]|uniref:Uncharacterized protein n=1 Tax=Melghirimyces algeriensis TaxID=910412 RepID=A0A521BPW8_9BACL|nr:hypothetical protein SAMN06264849_102276 [Melghirimyces algeriensis]
MIFVLLGTFIVLNLFVGVIVNKVEEVEHTQHNKDIKKEIQDLRKEIQELKQTLKRKE